MAHGDISSMSDGDGGYRQARSAATQGNRVDFRKELLTDPQNRLVWSVQILPELLQVVTHGG
jgi:hypothetical protein